MSRNKVKERRNIPLSTSVTKNEREFFNELEKRYASFGVSRSIIVYKILKNATSNFTDLSVLDSKVNIS